MQPLALKRIHNTNSPVSLVVVSVFAASQDKAQLFQKTAVTDSNKRRFRNDMRGWTSGVDTSVRHGPLSLQSRVKTD